MIAVHASLRDLTVYKHSNKQNTTPYLYHHSVRVSCASLCSLALRTLSCETSTSVTATPPPKKISGCPGLQRQRERDGTPLLAENGGTTRTLRGRGPRRAPPPFIPSPIPPTYSSQPELASCLLSFTIRCLFPTWYGATLRYQR